MTARHQCPYCKYRVPVDDGRLRAHHKRPGYWCGGGNLQVECDRCGGTGILTVQDPVIDAMIDTACPCGITP
jgi:hypothetical protein